MENESTLAPKKMWVTISLIAANFITYIINIILAAKGVPVFDIFSDNYVPIITDHEYYRLLTCMFVHAGTDHLINNMMVLLVIGSRYEIAEGHINTIISYFSGGILAGIVSMLYNMFNNTYTGSVGASGAIFALVGAFMAALVIHKGRLAGISTRQMIVFAAFSLYGGFANANTDNIAHISGLILGFLTGLVVSAVRRMIKKKEH